MAMPPAATSRQMNTGQVQRGKRSTGPPIGRGRSDASSAPPAPILALGDKGLLAIERCFRSPKRTQIQMMPMYHWAGRRIESRVLHPGPVARTRGRA